MTRYWRTTLTASVYDRACSASVEGRVVAGLTWLRGREAHHIATPSSASGRISRYFYDHYNCWDWTPTPPAGGEPIRDDYVNAVAGREIRVVQIEVDKLLSDLVDMRWATPGSA